EAAARAHRGRDRRHPVAAGARWACGLRTTARDPAVNQTLDVTIVTGVSAAADVLEDLGFFVIDNLPPALITNVCELASDKKKPQRFALVVDVRSGEFVGELEAA